MKKLFLSTVLFFTIFYAFSQYKSAFSFYPYTLSNKLKLKYERKVGSKSSLGSFGYYYYGQNFQGYKLEPFFRHYKEGSIVGRYYQISASYGKLSSNFVYSYFDVNSLKTEYFDYKSNFESTGVGFGYGVQERWSHVTFDIFCGVKLCTFPVKSEMYIDYTKLTLVDSYNIWYRTVGPGTLFTLSIGYSYIPKLRQNTKKENEIYENNRVYANDYVNRAYMKGKIDGVYVAEVSWSSKLTHAELNEIANSSSITIINYREEHEQKSEPIIKIHSNVHIKRDENSYVTYFSFKTNADVYAEEQEKIKIAERKENEKKEKRRNKQIDAFNNLVNQYKSNMPNDYQYITLNAGDVYIGQVENNARNGQGVYIWKQQEDTHIEPNYYDGNWVDGKQDGYGTHTYYTFVNYLVATNWTKNVYSGSFKNGVEDGEGYLGNDRVLYRNGELIRNYSEEERNARYNAENNNSNSTNSNNTSKVDNSLKIPEVRNERKSEEMENLSDKIVWTKYDVTFEDGVRGYLFFFNNCNKFGISDGFIDYYYNSKEDALKALYVYKKSGEILESVNCD